MRESNNRVDEYAELIAEESDDSDYDYGDAGDGIHDWNESNVSSMVDPFSIEELTKMPCNPLSWDEVQNSLQNIFNRIDYSSVSAISCHRWREIGASKILSEFAICLLEAPINANKNVTARQKNFIIDSQQLQTLWSKFTFMLRDRALDESKKDLDNMDSFVALIVLLKRLVEKEPNSNDLKSIASARKKESTILQCLASLCSSLAVRKSRRKSSDLMRFVISLFPWFSKIISSSYTSFNIEPLSSVLEFIVGSELSLNGSFSQVDFDTECSSKIISTGLFREIVLLYNATKLDSSDQSHRRLIRSILSMCSHSKDLLNYVSRVPSFVSKIQSIDFFSSCLVESVLWALFSYESNGKGLVKLVPISNSATRVNSIHNVYDPKKSFNNGIDIIFERTTQLLLPHNEKDKHRINIAAKDDFLFFVNFVSSSLTVTAKMQSIEGEASLEGKLKELQQIIVKWKPQKGLSEENSNINDSKDNENMGLSEVVVDSIRKSLKQLSLLLERTTFDPKSNKSQSIGRYQRSSKTD